MDKFTAFVIDEKEKKIQGQFQSMSPEDLGDIENSVLIRGEYSSIGYKDALAATGRGKILRTFPLIGGQDVAGVVVHSGSPELQEGDRVVITGHGLGEARHGGLSQLVRVPAVWGVKLHPELSTQEAMALGTAGFTAAQSILVMERNGQNPEMGPVVVTGATGGVGSVAINILSQKGYEVIAVSGRPELRDYLFSLGAHSVMTVEELQLGDRMLEKGRFGGCIDNLGGNILTKILPHIRFNGSVAAVGLAMEPQFATSVMPFIIRGVNLLGINSTYCPEDFRREIWQRLATDLKPSKLNKIISGVIPFGEIEKYFDPLLDRKLHGRLVVKL